jgi:hypothetical protein
MIFAEFLEKVFPALLELITVDNVQRVEKVYVVFAHFFKFSFKKIL